VAARVKVKSLEVMNEDLVIGKAAMPQHMAERLCLSGIGS
jgi:hypothetical protein